MSWIIESNHLTEEDIPRLVHAIACECQSIEDHHRQKAPMIHVNVRIHNMIRTAFRNAPHLQQTLEAVYCGRPISVMSSMDGLFIEEPGGEGPAATPKPTEAYAGALRVAHWLRTMYDECPECGSQNLHKGFVSEFDEGVLTCMTCDWLLASASAPGEEEVKA